MSDLKNCPFCGSDEVSIHHDEDQDAYWIACICNATMTAQGNDDDKHVKAAWNRRAVPQANAEQDAERINYLEAWNTKNKGKGFFWNTFSFSVSKTVREQLDESIRAASKTTPSSGEGA